MPAGGAKARPIRRASCSRTKGAPCVCFRTQPVQRPLTPMADTSRSSAPARSPSTERALTGIPGLDAILGGGLPTNHLYLIDGEPGAGKTTLALQFLLEGARNGEKGLYVTLSESRAELLGVARSHGWSLDTVDVFELVAEEAGVADEGY